MQRKEGASSTDVSCGRLRRQLRKSSERDHEVSKIAVWVLRGSPTSPLSPTHPFTPQNLKLAGELFFKFIFETCTNMNLEIVLEWVRVKGCLADGVAQRRECCPSLQKVMRLGPAGEQGSVHSHIIISKARPCRCCLAGVPLSRRVPSHSGLAWALVEMLRVIVRQP